MVGCHHRLNGQESEQTLGDGEGQGSLTCCSPWGRKEPDMAERLNDNNDFDQVPPVSGIVQETWPFMTRFTEHHGLKVCLCHSGSQNFLPF